MSNAYDSVVSLGYNCEVEFQLERIGLRERHPLFAWMFVPLHSLTGVIANKLMDLASPENVVINEDGSNILYDKRFQVYYHGPKELTKDHPRAARLLEIFSQGVNVAANGFCANAQSSARTLYILKVENASSREDVERLETAIETVFPQHDFQLAVVRERADSNAKSPRSRISQHFVERFAPIEEAYAGLVEDWDQVFREIGLAAP